LRLTVKLGGSILEDGDIRMRLLSQVSSIAKQGHQIILVHGGGKSLNRRLSQMQMASEFIEGLRKTDADTLQAAVMVLAGEVNKKIVAELIQVGTPAVGICGADAEAVQCVSVEGLPGYPAGIGFVGKPTKVNKSFFEMMLSAGLTPVVSSIAIGADCHLYNVNADQMASACASGVGCASLVFLTDVPGVRDGNGSVLSRLSEDEIRSLRTRGILSGGMLPKTSSCLEAIAAGVGSVHILPGSSPDVLTKFIDGTLREGTCIHGNN
jgi:acetylglutamate kinase